MENINHCIGSINCDLQRVDNWAKANELSINPSNSKCLLLSRTKTTFVVPDIIISGNKLDFVESGTILGITFNGRPIAV